MQILISRIIVDHGGSLFSDRLFTQIIRNVLKISDIEHEDTDRARLEVLVSVGGLLS